MSKISGKEQIAYLTEDQVASPSHPYRMNPLIFYRISKPCKDITKLPTINLSKFYE